MSADRWNDCPNCARLADEARKQAKDLAAEQYGKIPADEWFKLNAAANAPVVGAGATLREDWEIYGVTSGTLVVSYGCSCSVCGFSFDFRDEKVLPLT